MVAGGIFGFVIGGGLGGAKNSYGPALIDDDTPTPEHARFSLRHLVRLLLIGAGLWVLSLGPFLPSFLFILIGGPLVESTHNAIKFTAPLTGITAAVVGVILNLALFFGYHVLWPKGFGGALDWPCAAIAAAAAIALFRFKRGVIEVLFACALAGLAVHLLRA